LTWYVHVKSDNADDFIDRKFETIEEALSFAGNTFVKDPNTSISDNGRMCVRKGKISLIWLCEPFARFKPGFERIEGVYVFSEEAYEQYLYAASLTADVYLQ